jgi:hypothetical protein
MKMLLSSFIMNGHLLLLRLSGCVIFILLCQCPLQAQNNDWKQELEKLPNEQARLQHIIGFLKKGDLYYIEHEREMASEALWIANGLNTDSLLGDAHLYMGQYYRKQGKLDYAWLEFNRARFFFIKAGLYDKAAGTVYNQGKILQHKAKGDSILRFLDKNRFLVRLANERTGIKIEMLYALAYSKLKKEDTALAIYHRIYEHAKAINDSAAVFAASMNIAPSLQDFDATMIWLKRARTFISDDSSSSNYVSLMYITAVEYLQRDDIRKDSALFYLEEAEKNIKNAKSAVMKVNICNALGVYFDDKEEESELQLKYYRKAYQLSLLLETENHPLKGVIINNLALTFVDLRQLDSASYYLDLFKRRLDNNRVNQEYIVYFQTKASYEIAKSRDSCNIGALQDYSRSVFHAVKDKNTYNAIPCINTIIDCIEKQQGGNNAIEVLADSVLSYCGFFYPILKTEGKLLDFSVFLANYAALESLYGSKTKTVQLYKELSLVLKQINDEEYAKGMGEIIVKYRSDLKDQEIAYGKKVNIFLVSGTGLLLVIALLVYNRKRLKHKQQQQKILAEKQRVEEDLAVSEERLNIFMQNILEKNDLIEQLQKEIDKQNDPAAFSLQRHTILTHSQWEHFRELFEKVHGGYLERLKEKLPGLSPAETRFMALAKLNFGSKQMADTLGTGTDAIRMMRHRLRKKLNLAEEGSLEELIAGI